MTCRRVAESTMGTWQSACRCNACPEQGGGEVVTVTPRRLRVSVDDATNSAREGEMGFVYIWVPSSGELVRLIEVIESRC